ncbi:MAG: hypothetical protein ABJ360_17510 [Roseobacter sp.]
MTNTVEKTKRMARAAPSGGNGAVSRDPPGTLMQLARVADTSPQTLALESTQNHANSSTILQCVKSELNEASVFRGNMRAAVMREFPGKGTATPQAIFDKSQTYYQDNVVRGRKLISGLSDLKANPDATAANVTKAAASDVTHSARYDTSTPRSSHNSHHYLAGTAATGHNKKAYTNNILVPERSIQSNENYAKHDPNRAKGDYLSNSEVFWQQWKAGVAADTQSGPFKNFRRGRKQKDLKDVVRVSISNPETLLTVHYALPNGSYFQDGTTFEFGPEQEEFAALLGTPNGRGIGYLLKDHYHELTRNSFGSVEGDGKTTKLKFNLA